MDAVDKQSSEALPLQIKRMIGDRIRSGLLSAGERLPTVRQLAARLGVSPVTVLQAYAALEQAGLVVRRQGAGVFVRARPEGTVPARHQIASPAAEWAWQQELPDHVPRSLGWPLEVWEIDRSVIQMQSAVVGADLLPIPDLVHELQSAVLNDPHILATYSPVAGMPRLRETAAAYLRSIGVPATPQDVLITQGVQQGIDLVARTFIGPGDGVAVESPTYPPAVDAFCARGARIYPIAVDSEGMRVEELADLPDLRLVYTVPTYHNPTGVVMSHRRRGMLLEIARERGLLVVEDAPWSEVQFGHRPPPPLKSQDPGGHVIYLKSFGKLLAVGVRVGGLVASGRVMQRLLAAKNVTDQGTALLPQVTIQSFLDSPRMHRHIRSLVSELRARRDLLLRTLEAAAPRGVRWTTPEGGISIWVTLPKGWDTEALLPAALARGLCFTPGASFFPADPPSNYLRLCFGLGKQEEVVRGTTILCDLLREHGLSAHGRFWQASSPR